MFFLLEMQSFLGRIGRPTRYSTESFGLVARVEMCGGGKNGSNGSKEVGMLNIYTRTYYFF